MIINNSKVQEKVSKNGKVKNKLRNALQAFFFGGLIGLFGQTLYFLYQNLFSFDDEISSLLVSISIVVIAFLMTCFGIFDKFVLIAHAGALIPISGFANSITACALEGKSEGLIFGIGSKMFSLIGSVCTYGIVSSIILGIIYFLKGVLL